MNEAARIVGAAVLGLDGKTVVVDGTAYTIMPPTIERLAGAAYYLTGVENCASLEDVVSQMKNIESVSKALAWFVCEPKETKMGMIEEVSRLAPILARGGIEEVMEALKTAYSLIDIGNFTQLSTLARSVGMLTAKPRPQAMRVY